MLNEELIKQLFLNACDYVEETSSLKFNRERFAELIVRECVAVIESGEFMQGTAHNDTKKIIALNQRKIKQHFGVEE